MATRTSTKSGSWSDASVWDTGLPVDGDAVTIAAGHAVLMDVDTSAFVGLFTVTIQGSAGTPGMLYFAGGTSGYLKLRTGYNIVGTTGANKGRLLTNSDGVWANSVALPFADKAVINLQGTAQVDCTYLDVKHLATHPTLWSVRIYGTKWDIAASDSTVDTVNDTIDCGASNPGNNAWVMVTAASGNALPGGLEEDVQYNVYIASGNKVYFRRLNDATTQVHLTSVGSGTFTIFTGPDSGSATVNVLDDVSGDSCWSTTTDHNRVVVVNASVIGGGSRDVQVTTLSAVSATQLTLAAVLDSNQTAGARIWMISRNVSTRSWGTTVGQGIYDYHSSTTGLLAGVFGGEIVNLSGNNTCTTCYGYGTYTGRNHTVSGIVAFCNSGMVSVGGSTSAGVPGPTVSGVIVGCQGAGLGYGTWATLTGTITGCGSGCNAGAGYTLGGIISCCTNGVGGFDHTISGVVRFCAVGVNAGYGFLISGTVINCSTGASYGNHLVTGHVWWNNNDFGFFNDMSAATSSRLLVTCRGNALQPTPRFANRNYTGIGRRAFQGVFCEDFGGVSGACRAFLQTGDVIRNTTTVRPGGAASSLEVVPLSGCGIQASIRVLEWTELDVPASAQTRSVYIKGGGWTVWPTAAQLWLEAEYYDSSMTKVVLASTDVLTDNVTWTPLTVAFTPGQAGTVRYRLYLAAYQAASKIYVDNMLVTS